MKKYYVTLQGEPIDRTSLEEDAQNHISLIEKLIADSTNYFEVNRQALAPLQEGKFFTPETLRKLHDSPRYKIVFDLITRYHRKLYKPEEG